MADSRKSTTPSWVSTTLTWLAAEQWAQQDPDTTNQEHTRVQQRFYTQYQHLVRRDIESPPRSEPELHGRSFLPCPPNAQGPEKSVSSEDLIKLSPQSSVDIKGDHNAFRPEKATQNLLLPSPKTSDDDQIHLLSDQEHQRDQATQERKMLPANFGSVPYTISSEDWALSSNSSNTSQSFDMSEEQYAARRESVVSVYSTVYAIAKIVFVIFQNYGVEVDNTPAGLKFHIERAEIEVTSNSLLTLIKTIEGLYYVLYARLTIEIANVHLCSSFDLDIRRMSGKDSLLLPEPSHLYAILRAFKDFLRSPDICSVLDREIIKQHQEDFVHRAVEKTTQMGHAPDDLVGYRRHILKLVSDPNSPFCRRWRGLYPIYQMAPGEILAILSEKYLSVEPRQMNLNSEAGTRELPFIDPERVDPDLWEREIIQDNRQATWAKLEGKSVGEMRREDKRRPLVDYVRERKCICFSFCSCANECTNKVERPCPCAERMMRILLAEQDPGSYGLTFPEHCNELAEVAFEGLAAIHRGAENLDDAVAIEVKFSLDLFEKEVAHHRDAAAKAKELL